MRRYLLIFLGLTTILSAQVGIMWDKKNIEDPKYAYTRKEKVKFDLPQGSGCWNCLEEVDLPNGYLYVEWIPEEQSLLNWTEMIVESFDRKPVQANQKLVVRQLVERIRESLKKTYPNMDISWNVIRESNENDVAYQYVTPADKKGEKLHYFSRLIYTSEGLHLISYEKKTKAMSDADIKKWVRFLNHAKVVRISKDEKSGNG